MKIVTSILFLALLSSCSQHSNREQEKPDRNDEHGEIAELQSYSNDSVLYVNRVGYFSETNEFYVPLNFTKPFGNDIYDFLEDKTDSLIFDNGEKSRRRLPMEVAKDVLDLRQLGEIRIFDTNHQYITNAKLKRAEYLVDLNGYFIAVFSPDKKGFRTEEGFYCLGTAKVDLKSIKVIELEDEQLTATIRKEVEANPEYISRVEHLKILPYNTIYSIYAFVGKDGGATSYLTEFKNNKLTVLHRLEDEVAFDRFLPIPLERNGKPVLLIDIILPDSDAVDDCLVSTFDGLGYVLEKDNRIITK